VRVAVTEIGWDGTISRRVLDTWQLPDADRWETLIQQILAFPPQYRAGPGRSIYVIHSGDRAVLVGEHVHSAGHPRIWPLPRQFGAGTWRKATTLRRVAAALDLGESLCGVVAVTFAVLATGRVGQGDVLSRRGAHSAVPSGDRGLPRVPRR
jgi:hypothetical protein